MPRTVGQTGSKWFTCDNCGFDYPIKFLQRQRGLKFCTYLPCSDEPGGQTQGQDPRKLNLTEGDDPYGRE